MTNQNIKKELLMLIGFVVSCSLFLFFNVLVWHGTEISSINSVWNFRRMQLHLFHVFSITRSAGSSRRDTGDYPYQKFPKLTKRKIVHKWFVFNNNNFNE